MEMDEGHEAKKFFRACTTAQCCMEEKNDASIMLSAGYSTPLKVKVHIQIMGALDLL